MKDKKVNQTEQQSTSEEEGAPERAETKDNRLKVLWSSDLDLSIAFTFVVEQHVIYPNERHSAHLAWVPPVPTPPPNQLV